MVISLSACFSTLPVEFRKIDALNINTQENIPQISFDMVMNNPNNWGFKIVNIETELLLDQHAVGSIVLPRNFKVKRKAESRMPVKISTSTQELLTILPSGIGLLLGSQSMDAIVHGKITFGKFLFRKKYPFEIRQKVDNKMMKGALGF